MGCGSSNKNVNVTAPDSRPAFVVTTRIISYTSIDPFEENKEIHVPRYESLTLIRDSNTISAPICPTCQTSLRDMPEHQRSRHLLDCQLIFQTQEMLNQLNNVNAIR